MQLKSYSQDSSIVFTDDDHKFELLSNKYSELNDFSNTCENFIMLSSLRSSIRYKTLVAEVDNSDTDLQILQPVFHDDKVLETSKNFVKNGLNEEKSFLQVHYLKGYFLLRYLSKLVDLKAFISLLRKYVFKYHGQLVRSKDFLELFFKEFPSVKSETMNTNILSSEWLRNAGLNATLVESFSINNNALNEVVKKHYNHWKICYHEQIKVKSLFKKSKRKKCLQSPNCLFSCLTPFLFPDQIVLLLENFLENDENNITRSLLSEIYTYYKISNQNADVRHRWCELVIKYKYPCLKEVEKFLLEDQAMGVYLYGELIISKSTNHKQLAFRCFESVKSGMDEDTKNVVAKMLGLKT